MARLPDRALSALGLPTPAYAFSWGADLYRHTGYWGEVAVPYREPEDKTRRRHVDRREDAVDVAGGLR